MEDHEAGSTRPSKVSKRGLKRDVGSVFGRRWSARIQQQAKVFYGIVQGRSRCRGGDATPDRARSYMDDGTLRRSSERKRRPRRVFSPHPHNRERENGLLLIGTVRLRLKFTHENPTYTTDDALEYVRIDVEELSG